MCGRIALYTPPERLARAFGARLSDDVDPAAPPRWNVGPTSQVLALTAVPGETPGRTGGPAGPDRAGGRPGAVAGPARDAPPAAGGGTSGPDHPALVLGRYRWGLVPSWADDPSIGSRLFNARAETVATKPSFRSAFRSRRAAVVADGFMEWQAGPGGRQPYFFRRADGAPLAFAGLWERWPGPGGDPGVTAMVTCTVITTDAGPDVAAVHDRMPVVLEREDLDRWLRPEGGQPDVARAILRPAARGVLVGYPIDRRVGNVRNDDPAIIEPTGPAGT